MKYNFLKANIEKGIHELHECPKNKLSSIEEKLPLPIELKEFYINFGYGFFFIGKGSINRLVGPDDFALMNLRQGYYEFDPDLEYYQTIQDKLIFFEVNEGVFLLIDKVDEKGSNAIYFFDEKIADSLEEFLRRFDAEGHYFE